MKQLFVRFYILLFVGFFVIYTTIMPFVRGVFESEIDKGHCEVAKGTFFLLSQEMAGLDETAAREKIAKLQPEFGYPMVLKTVREVKAPEKYQNDLINGDVVRDEKNDRHFMRLPGSDLVLVLGPYFLGDLTDRARYFFWGVVTALLVLPAGIWAFFFQRNLKNMERVTQRFVSGDHSARLKLPKVLPLQKLAAAFNHMAEKTQNLIASQKDLVNAVSHEIRTPLSRIKFSLEMLEPLSQEHFGKRNHVQEISRDVDEINSLVDEMLSYAKFEVVPESSKGLPDNEVIFWLKRIVKIEQNNASQADIMFKADPEIEKHMMKYEPVYLGWAVRNFIRNAVKYARSKIDVTLEIQEECCFIHVDDDGPGIPQQAREKIFEPFYRLDQSRNKESGNYGLGLSIAKRIALWHKGTVSVSSSPMLGARFTIQLPII